MAGHRKWSELRAKMSLEQRAAIDAAAAEMLRQLPLRYPAIITTEGQYTLAEFPDCPGCQTFAKLGEDILLQAQEALKGWLEATLDAGGELPTPSMDVKAPVDGQVIMVLAKPEP